MSAEVLNFKPKKSSEKLSSLENLLFEKHLINKLSNTFLDKEIFMFDHDYIETDLVCDEVPLCLCESNFLNRCGVFEEYYGNFMLDLNCTTNGYVDFSCCFDNPSIEMCRTHFKPEQFTQIFGKGSRGEIGFERYLKSFLIGGELHQTSQGNKIAELRSLQNLRSWPLIEGYTLIIVEPILMHSIQQYFKKFDIYC